MILRSSRLFCDTSFFFAALYPRDVNYKKAGLLIEESIKREAALYTTWDVISETITLLRYRYSFRAAIRFLDEIRPALHVVYYDDSIREEAELVFRKSARDKKISFCDAISFVVVTSVLEGIPCLSFDRDFKRLGLTVIDL